MERLMVTDRTEPWPSGAAPCLRSGVAAERSNPTFKERRQHGRRKAERSYFMFKVRRGNLVQGKEQSGCALLEQP